MPPKAKATVAKKSAANKPPAETETKLTQDALSKLADASNATVENALASWSPKDSNGLWKRFERSRVIESEDNSFKKATEGPGRNQSATQLLRVWLQGGLTTKRSVYQDATMQISS